MAAGDIYFAWVGGEIDPAFTLQTTGDLWSGSLSTSVDLWNGEFVTSGNTVKGSTAVELSDYSTLRSGKVYAIEGSGIPDGVTFTFAGIAEITLSAACTTSGNGISLKITNSTETLLAANLENTDGLAVGGSYGIAGQGLVIGTTFTYAGGTEITLSQAPTESIVGASVTITSSVDLDVVKNIPDLSGLVVGELYSIVGIGAPPNATFTYDGSAHSVRMYRNATQPGTGVTLIISKGATESDGGAFDDSIHAVEDEQIFEILIEQEEGSFATMDIDLVNPKVGLLRSARKRWCWVSWDDGAGIKPLFHGRLVGVPENIEGEVVRLQFVARPNDFAQQQAVLAASMRDLPYFDRLWMTPDKAEDPDAVLETRAALWHTDRLNLVVSTSSVVSGEDGTIELTADDHFYDAVEFSYGQPALRQFTVQATATWNQTAEGDVDLTDTVVSKLIDAGSPYFSPNVGTFTSDGLLSDWPLPGASFGGGWTVSADAITQSAGSWLQTVSYAVRYSAKDSASAEGSITVSVSLVNGSTSVTKITTNSLDLAAQTYDVTGSGIPDDVTIQISADLTSGRLSLPATETHDHVSLTLSPVTTSLTNAGLTTGYSNFDVVFDLTPINVYFPVHYVASRARSEVLTFTLLADTQLLLSDAEGADIDALVLSSDLVDKTIEADGTMPIGDPSRNCYFPTDRGDSSIQFLLLMAASKMLDRARAVKLKCEAPLVTLQEITCRKNLLVPDDRLPGGQAIGKVVSYQIRISGKGARTVAATIGCMIGEGGSLVTASAGSDTYADDYSDDYDESTGAQVDIIAGTLQYQSLAGTYVIDDDGVDFARMTPDRVVKSLIIINGPTDQQAAVDASVATGGDAKPIDAVKARPTRIDLSLVPVTGGAFRTNYVAIPSKLTIPKTINLEA